MNALILSQPYPPAPGLMQQRFSSQQLRGGQGRAGHGPQLGQPAQGCSWKQTWSKYPLPGKVRWLAKASPLLRAASLAGGSGSAPG